MMDVHLIDVSRLSKKEKKRFVKILSDFDEFCAYDEANIFGKKVFWSVPDDVAETLDVVGINVVIDGIKEDLGEGDIGEKKLIDELKELKKIMKGCKAIYLEVNSRW
jgi:hypothetical protein